MFLQYASYVARNPQSGKTALRPTDVLASPATSFSGLLERAGLLLRLERLVCSVLEPELAGRVRVANLRQNRLILLTPSAAWATRLRMVAPKVVDDLRRSGFTDVESIDVRVGQLPPEPPAERRARPLSSAARQALDLMARLGKESED
jgi:hypothetical protein